MNDLFDSEELKDICVFMTESWAEFAQQAMGLNHPHGQYQYEMSIAQLDEVSEMIEAFHLDGTRFSELSPLAVNNIHRFIRDDFEKFMNSVYQQGHFSDDEAERFGLKLKRWEVPA